MRGRRPELTAIPGGLSDDYEPDDMPVVSRPAHIPESMHAEWDRIIVDLNARKLYEPSMEGIVASYVIAVYQVRECVKAIQTDGAFVRTKNGEPKPHPAHGLMNKANEIVARLGAELGITPLARARKALKREGDADNDGAPAGLD